MDVMQRTKNEVYLEGSIRSIERELDGLLSELAKERARILELEQQMRQMLTRVARVRLV